MTDQADPKSLIRIARENGEPLVAAELDLGARVRELRRELGLTLEQASKQAGLARSTLSKIENGQMSPTYEALKKLASGFRSACRSFSPRRRKNRSTGA